MWTWYQREGEIWRDGILKGVGYSGAGEGKNNPAMQFVHDVGPIPCGRWKIVGPPQHTKTHGPYVLRLQPEPGTDTHGRSGFLVHGDSVKSPGTASHGCIILPQWARAMVWVSGDRNLIVESRNPAAMEAA